MRKIALLSLAAAALAWAEESSFGLASPMTFSFFSGQTRRATAVDPDTMTAAFRANFYPTVKLGSNWFAYAAIQAHSGGYFYEELAKRDHTVSVNVMQAYVGYSRMRTGRALTVKVGQLSSAFGSFPLRYDDSRNWLIDLPIGYGYYYTPVTVYGMPGAEVDATLGDADFRLQLTNSSPSNPRKLTDHDQYLNWTAGAGYTVLQGFRIGVSAVRGPYLHRQHRFFFPGEATPKTLPGTGYGTDVQWGRGRWNVNGEAQRFQYAYRAMPYFFSTTAYSEAKFAMSPRWYLAGRAAARWRSSGMGRDQAYEMAIGFRPGGSQLVKVGYEHVIGPFTPGTRDNVLGVQYSLTLNPPALTWDGKR